MAIQIHNHKGEEVIDPYNSFRIYEKHKERKLEAFPLPIRGTIEQYINDMAKGKNTAGSKGKRGYNHLNTLLSRLKTLNNMAQQRYNKTLLDLTTDDALDLFEAMERGKIKKEWGTGSYKSTHDYIKIFKAFWHWHMKIHRLEKKEEVQDITVDLTGNNKEKPHFVYFTVESLRKMLDHAKYEYKVIMLFMFDSGCRVTEMLNIKRKDIGEVKGSDKVYVEIRPETSKTFGRKFKLMLSSDMIKEYIKRKGLKNDDFLFPYSPHVINLYIKRLSEKIFGKDLINLEENKGNKKLITLYDFRHSSCCYWLPRYKNESALKWRFGWKESDMIYYYSEFLGMKDTIQEDDLLVDVTKTELENELSKQQQEIQILQDRLAQYEKDKEKMLKSEVDRIAKEVLKKMSIK